MKSDILGAAMNRAPAERTVTILGATGSVGRRALELVDRYLLRTLNLQALPAGSHVLFPDDLFYGFRAMAPGFAQLRYRVQR